MKIYFTKEGLVFEGMTKTDEMAVELADMFFKEYGMNVSVSGCHYKGEERGADKIEVDVKSVYRHNGTDENVNVDITVIKWAYYKNGHDVLEAQRVEKVRVPVNASERVKANRINKIVKAYEEANK